MIHLLQLASLLAQLALASTAQVPYYLRELSDQKDVGAVNENFRNLSDVLRKAQSDISAVESASSDYLTAGSSPSITGSWTFVNQPSGIYNIAIASSAAAQTFTSASFTGVAGSTVSLTLPGSGRVRVSFHGTMYSGSSGGYTYRLGLIGNGKVLQTKLYYSPGNADGMPVDGSAVSEVLTAGTYTFSASIACPGGNSMQFGFSADDSWELVAEAIR